MSTRILRFWLSAMVKAYPPMNDRVQQQTLHVDENIAFLAECDGEGISTNRSAAGLSEG
jgi:hypothetical protein